ncbi:hypothetical protein [Flavobacterium sp.]|uniref:hypothetical protein n=1 Tax=Flavobacterium sp. TaxID=239 RepID=UPI003D6BC333
MKSILLGLFFLFSGLNVAAQNTIIVGKVLSDVVPIAGVEIINLRSKTVDVSNENGEFSISVTSNDTLRFYAKEFTIKDYVIHKEDFSLTNWVVQLVKKPIELEEVEIKNSPKFKVDVSYESLSAIKIGKEQSRPQPLGVYTGEIPNGMDFGEIGRKIKNLIFKKNKDNKKEIESVNFKDYVAANFLTDFFVKQLNLKAEEVDLFIDFCNADEKAKTVVSQNGILDVMQFLLRKRDEFITK